jgi:hypothetical protein
MKFSEIRSLNFHLEDCGGAKWKCLVHKLFPGPVETEAHYLPPVCSLTPLYVALQATVLHGTKPLKPLVDKK